MCWEALLENVLGEDKVRAQYLKMEKQAQMPPVTKQVRDLHIWSSPFRFLLVFLLDRVMDTGKYFSSMGEVAGMSVIINRKRLQNSVNKGRKGGDYDLKTINSIQLLPCVNKGQIFQFFNSKWKSVHKLEITSGSFIHSANVYQTPGPFQLLRYSDKQNL